MKILEIDVDFDFADADDMKRFEETYPITMGELTKIQEKNQNEKEKMANSEQIREFCNVISNFFDKVFGEGVSNKVFKGKANYMVCLRAFKSVVAEKEKQDAEMDEIAAYVEKYSPDRVKRS